MLLHRIFNTYKKNVSTNGVVVRRQCGKSGGAQLMQNVLKLQWFPNRLTSNRFQLEISFPTDYDKRSRWHLENGVQRNVYFVFVSEGGCFEEKSFCAVRTDGQATIWEFCEPIIWCFTAVCLSKPLPSSWSPCATFRLPKSSLLDENTPKCFYSIENVLKFGKSQTVQLFGGKQNTS